MDLLYYFEDEESAVSKGLLVLTPDTKVGRMKDRQFGFAVVASGRTLYMDVDSEAEREKWCVRGRCVRLVVCWACVLFAVIVIFIDTPFVVTTSRAL